VHKNNSQDNSLRITGGKWSSRKVKFNNDDNQQLKPTPDRVRETLFNWLTPYINNNTLGLDLFSGSGILGLELLSRGAQQVTMIDKNNNFANIVDFKQNNNIITVQDNIANYFNNLNNFNNSNNKFDIIFMDPPYDINQHGEIIKYCLRELISKQLLKPNTLIYYEHNSALIINNMEIIKNKKYGNIYFYLGKSAHEPS